MESRTRDSGSRQTAARTAPVIPSIYAPRDENEIDIVRSIVAASKRNAQSAGHVRSA